MGHATPAIPIVTAIAGDPVEAGLVASLAKPGGNVTGLSTLAAELEGKRLELFKQAVPTLARVVTLLNPANPFTGGADVWSRALMQGVDPRQLLALAATSSTGGAPAGAAAGAPGAPVVGGSPPVVGGSPPVVGSGGAVGAGNPAVDLGTIFRNFGR